MTNENTMSQALAATLYGHATMSKGEYHDLLELLAEGRKTGFLRFNEPFYCVEYLNSPLGIQVYAYSNINDCQAFYPASIDFQKETGIIPFENTIVPVISEQLEPRHLWHTMSRKTTGFLIHAAYGRMIQADTSEAPTLDIEDFRILEVHDTPAGLVVAALKGKKAHVIYPVSQDVGKPRVRVKAISRAA